MYFTFYIFSVSVKEAQKTEKRDVIVPSFNCQDKFGKVLVAEANGDWKIGNNPQAEDRFKEQDESKMEGNLQNLIKRTVMRVCGKLDYQTQITGENVGEEIIGSPGAPGDMIFIRECEKYGIEFHNLLVEVIAKDLEQENANSYYQKLLKEEMSRYPQNHTFTKDELTSIHDIVQLRMKGSNTRKIITNSALLGRYDT